MEEQMFTPQISTQRLEVAAITLAFSAIMFGSTGADAHGVVGKRFFPATIATEDPFVADELSLPTVSTFKEGDEPSTRTEEISAELAKRITDDFGLSVGYGWRRLKTSGESARTGWGNLELGAKYQVFTSAEHEALISLGLDAEIGGTGARRVDADRFSTLTPTVFFGKGFGDLPDGVELLRPLAVTGLVGYGIPTQAKSTHFTTDPDTGDVETEFERHPNVIEWGFAIQYSLPYLQANVRDIGLGPFFGRIIPLVEFAFETPVNRGQSGKTTGTINPGFLWAGQKLQFGVEAIVPVNDRTGHDVGVRAQLHFFLDDLFPNSVGKPLLGR
jgi:hypothetical protein